MMKVFICSKYVSVVYYYCYTVAVIAFSSPTYDGLESSGVVSATIIISGVVVSSKDIIVTISFTPATASGNINYEISLS